MILTRPRVPALALAAAALASRLGAQAAPPAPLAGSSYAITVNRLRLESDSRRPTAEVMLRFTALRPSRVSVDLALGVLEIEGLTAVALEVGPATTLLARPGVALLLRVGAMGLQTSAGTAAGGYAGVSAQLRLRGRAGVRLDVARQLYLTAAPAVGAWQVGGGIALLPRVR